MKLRKRLKKHQGLLAFLFVSGIGGIFVWNGVVGIQKAKAVKQWPSVRGTIIVCASRPVVYETRMGSQAQCVLSSKYSYQVGMTVYKGNRFSYQKDIVPCFQAEEIVKQYPVGQEVTVFYDPRDPQESALRLDVDSSTAGYSILFGCIFALLGGAIGFLNDRRYKK